MTTGKPRVLATRHFPPDVEARLAANFDAVLNPEDRLYDGPALIKAAAGFDGIMCAAGDPMNAETIAGLPASVTHDRHLLGGLRACRRGAPRPSAASSSATRPTC